MITFYNIKICPNCDQRMPVEIGYSCGFDSIIENSESMCLNESCGCIYSVETFSENTIIFNRKDKIFEIDDNEFQPNNVNLIGIESVRNHYNQILEYIDKKYNI